MVSDTWADQTLASRLSGPGAAGVAAAAQLDTASSALVLRAVNSGTAAATLTVSLFDGAFGLQADGIAWTLAAATTDADNTPGNPLAISPQQAPAPISSPQQVQLPLPPLSFVVARFPVAATAR